MKDERIQIASPAIEHISRHVHDHAGLHIVLADLFEYPDAEWDLNVVMCEQRTSVVDSELMTTLTSFCDEVVNLSQSSRQELYTRTFDLNPVCTLDIGYHLFGESYKRGVFLANLRETEAAYELGQEHQLPDYLPVLLRLVSKLEDEELRMALIAECLVPALVKMLQTLNESDNPYRYLVALVHAVLKSQVVEYPRTIIRAHLPILAGDPGSHPHIQKSEQAQSCPSLHDLANRPLAGAETNADLF